MDRKLDSELPITPDGEIYHLQCRAEDLADRIILVGDPGRPKYVASFFDPDSITFDHAHREIHTITGKYKGVRVSVMSTGMGPDNIEICINEIHALKEYDVKARMWLRDKQKEKGEPLTPPKVVMVRCGTCGCPQPDRHCGELAITQLAIGMDNTGVFYTHPSPPSEATVLAAAVKEPSSPLAEMNLYAAAASPLVVDALKKAAEKHSRLGYGVGITATGSGFYGCQGRAIGNFRGLLRYPSLVENLGAFRLKLPEEELKVMNIEMETSSLCHLSSILGYHAAAVCSIVAVRQGEHSEFIKGDEIKESMEACVTCGLEAVTSA